MHNTVLDGHDKIQHGSRRVRKGIGKGGSAQQILSCNKFFPNEIRLEMAQHKANQAQPVRHIYKEDWGCVQKWISLQWMEFLILVLPVHWDTTV